MNRERANLEESLVKAMQAEQEGHYFYMMAAATSTDPKGIEVFKRLAREEMEHFEFLKSQYSSLLQHGRLESEGNLGKPSVLLGPNPIFSDSLRARVDDAHFEMTALAVGIHLELSAIEFYKNAAMRAADPAATAFFTALAEWESTHYHALLRQQETLKQDYWSGAGFAPF